MSSTDVLIVGAGPTGLTAAAELRRLGLTVIVAEREREPGGIPRHTEHLGYGMRDLHRVLSGPTYASRLVDRAVSAGADLRAATTVLALDGTSADLRSSNGVERVAAQAVLLATGVRERPRSARLVPGDRPAGVLTTGALQQFSTLHDQHVGRRAVIVGAEHVSFSAVLTLRHLGCEVAAIVTALPRHQTYPPLRWATATRQRVPICTGIDVARIVGRHRVEAVELTDGSRIECDTVVFTGDWVPDHELARRAGCAMIPVAKAPLVGGGFHTTVPGVFAAGNLVHPAETADRCALDGRRVAASIRRYVDNREWRDPQAPIACTAPIRWASVTAGRITLRVDRFVTGRVLVSLDGDELNVSRPMRMVPNRSISIAIDDLSRLAGLSVEIVGSRKRLLLRRRSRDGATTYPVT